MVLDCTKEYITPQIIFLMFKTQEAVCRTFCRPQESYEHPHFRGKIFSRDEFILHYVAHRDGERYDYNQRWNGFNIPSTVLQPFYDGKFNPLSDNERDLLEVMKEDVRPFYLIATHAERAVEDTDGTTLHEIAHGLFFTNPAYNSEVLAAIQEYDCSALERLLTDPDEGNYHRAVIPDEVHAYHLACSRRKMHFRKTLNKDLHNQLKEIFLRYAPKHPYIKESVIDDSLVVE